MRTAKVAIDRSATDIEKSTKADQPLLDPLC
jgi:hypothetical protein